MPPPVCRADRHQGPGRGCHLEARDVGRPPGGAGRDTDREAPQPGPAAQDADAAEPAERDDITRSVRAWDAPAPAGAARPAAAEDDEARDDGARDDAVRDDTGQEDAARGAGARGESAREDEGGPDGEAAAPMWTNRPQASLGTESTVVSKPPVVTQPFTSSARQRR